MPKEKPELSDAMRAKLSRKTPEKNPINGTKFTIAISSAKGGVGKSTFATNLALALKKVGCKVGLLDADIYGPSVPKMLGINEKPKSIREHQIKYDKEMPGIGYSLFKEYLKSSTAWRTGFHVTKGLVYSGSSKVAKNKPEVKIRIRLISRLIRRVMNLLYFPMKTRQIPNPIAIRTVSK